LLITTEFEVLDISVRAHDKTHGTAAAPGEELIAVMIFAVCGMTIFNRADLTKQLVNVFAFLFNRRELTKDSRLLPEAFVDTGHLNFLVTAAGQPCRVERNVIRVFDKASIQKVMHFAVTGKCTKKNLTLTIGFMVSSIHLLSTQESIF
jgi:hypothetical protein